MTALLVLLLGLAGGLGAVARFVVDGVVRARVRSALPAGTIFINVSGSFLLGLLAGATLHGAPAALQAIAGTGFLGGYTTFSTASVETVRLIQAGRVGMAAANALVTLVLSLATAALGLWIGLIW
ncbi:fluoride efflux transporter CrcB [Sinomonas terrae]|uniref:Fluoride-specific ion channel FluC n=1 Tax=Sinomonas terrae TaxID=2908838 RepID=A0ABS9U4T2_9MICC|nr:fluoride efflux transporter CrcB [Sinomonas terrae]MCH6471417.1 fluoride efflux transporter CrcB [Sinomonas terrae]